MKQENVISTNVISGSPNKAKANIIRRIKYHGGKYDIFKIGVSSDPEQRAYNYEAKYKKMLVMYKTSSLNYIIDMEKLTIEEFQKDSKNVNSGGGGNFDKDAKEYYLYVVFGNKKTKN